MDNARRKRIRTVVSALNKARRKQNQKIDIICNDVMKAHENFIIRLQEFRFAADLYENLIGSTSLNQIAETAGEFFTNNMPETNTVMVFADDDTAKLHFFGENPKLRELPAILNDTITQDLTAQVCRTNRICHSQNLCQLGISLNPAIMKQISIAAIPLAGTTDARGMVVFYRPCENKIRDAELSRAASVMPGIAKAVRTCRTPHTASL